MGRELHTYDKHQDSGVEWIGKIPQEWEVRQVKTLSKNLDNRRVPISAENREDGEFPYWGAAGIVDYINDYIFEGEFVLVGEDGAPFFDKSKKVSFTTKGKFWVNNHTHILQPNKSCDSRWFSYFLNTNDYKMYIKGSTRDKLDQSTLSRILVALPPLQTQRTIADYLDRETGDIDQLIAKDRQLIKLLQERRQSLIYHVVTGKIDTDGQSTTNLKDSGVEWIGKIPQEWEVRRLSHVFPNIGSGTTPATSNEDYYFPEEVNWLITGDLNDGFIEKISKKVSKKSVRELSALKEYKKDSVVIALYGATIGKLGILQESSTVNQACCVIERNQNQDSKFLFYYLLGSRQYILSLSYGGGQPNISQDLVRNLRISLPPLQTQRIIADYLDQKTASIDQAISKIQKRIDHLTEYRQSLIYHVVTGKVKVE